MFPSITDLKPASAQKMIGSFLKKVIIVRAEQGVNLAGWDPNEFLGGGGMVGCPLAEIDKGWGVIRNKQVRLSATGPLTASNKH